MARFLTEEADAAHSAGLHYVNDTDPGIRRVRSGNGFGYVGPRGKPVRDAATLRRIRSLVIPPAWTDVWICRDARGHIQATGRDDRGRKQYRYHSRWSAERDATKYHRMIAFAQALPRVRARVSRDLRRPGLPREKVLAAVVRLLETTLARVGNDEYARQNRSFGLTTMHDRHARVRGGKVHFEFRGKSGVRHTIDLHDRRLARIVKRCQDLPGQELFQYEDAGGRVRDVTSTDVNAYLRAIAGEEFTAKDFRTWAGTVLCARVLRGFEAVGSQTQAKKNVVRAIETVADRLGNTRAVCRKCYVHPAVIDAYLDENLRQVLTRQVRAEVEESLRRLRREEAAVLDFLEKALAPQDADRAGRSGTVTRTVPSAARTLRRRRPAHRSRSSRA
jgi:DNA topoisomerase-1